jgi:hypothetical protein
MSMGTAQNELEVMGVLTLGLLRHVMMARRCMVGHLSSRAQASTSGSGKVSPARTWVAEASGNPTGPS